MRKDAGIRHGTGLIPTGEHAVAGMGPAPKPTERRARRNATPASAVLPAAGRDGKVPRWPLAPNLKLSSGLRAATERKERLEAQHETEPSPALERQIALLEERIALLEDQIKASARAERAVWRELWAAPQAVEWERQGWLREVAQYARWKVLGELGDMDAAKEARQLSDRLGLTPLAMRRLGWQVDGERPAPTAAQPASQRSPSPGGARQRYGKLRVVQPGEKASGA